jgi:hypothetical protein
MNYTKIIYSVAKVNFFLKFFYLCITNFTHMESPDEDQPQQNPLQSGEYWEKMYSEFLEFRRKGSGGMPPSAIKGVPNPLYRWVQQQHQFKAFLSPVQLAKLNAARFTWATKEIDAGWEQWYQSFLEFRKTHPTGMPRTYLNKVHNPLYNWCDKQRKLKDMLDQKQLDKLNAANFEWETPMRIFEEGWEENFKKFEEFKSANPEMMPPTFLEGIINPLFLWCTSQRRLFRRLGPERKKRLLDAGFEKDKIEKLTQWDRRYLEFKAWRKDNPEGMPQRLVDGQPSTLQEWCIVQIKKRIKNQLTTQQIKKLDSVGFIWQIKDLDAAWEKNYEEFLEFRKTHPGGWPPSRLESIVNPLHSWMVRQRELHFKLSPARLSKLNSAGFEWEITGLSPKDAWERRFEEFLEFKKNNPGMMPPFNANDLKKRSLRSWCAKQNRIKHTLHPEQIKRLEDAGFVWFKPDYKTAWELHFNDYVEFLKEYPGKKPSQKGNEAEKILYRWCNRQSEGKSNLSTEKIKRLDDVGFHWAERSLNALDKWEKRFNDYLEFLAGNPEGIPPNFINGKKNPVCKWWAKQCREKHLLLPLQIKRMNDAGFVWKVTSTIEKWEEMYTKFKEFKENNPEETSVPNSHGPETLYEWCRTQRNAKKRLSTEQIQKLDALGFKWKAKDTDEAWEQHYQEYLQFRKKTPKGMPTAFYKGKANPLHNWCRVQQRFKNKMPPERIKKLDDAGFDWFVIYPDWNDYYKEFIEFRNTSHKGMPEDNDSVNMRNLLKWCQEQRENKELLPPEYIEKLDAAGFEWE